MSYRINISDLSLGQLNGACLAKISQFTRRLEQYDGTVVKLKDNQAIGQIVKIAKATQDPDLKQLYAEIKQEIKKHINSPKFEQFKSEFSEMSSTRSGVDSKTKPETGSHASQ